MENEKNQFCTVLAKENGIFRKSGNCMNCLATDIKTAVAIFSDIRKSRKGGAIKAGKTREIPVITVGLAFYDTVEGCTLSRYKDIKDIAMKEYDKLSETIKYRLSSAPKKGEFIERVILWKEILRPVLTDKQYHTAIRAIVSWYIYIIKLN